MRNSPFGVFHVKEFTDILHDIVEELVTMYDSPKVENYGGTGYEALIAYRYGLYFDGVDFE